MWAPLITPHRRHRQRKRRAVSLQDRSITSNTRIRYFVAVSAVLPALEKTTDDIDDFLVEWIDQEYIRGSSITSAAATLSGLHHFMPWCRGKIRAAWKLYGLGRRSERPRQAPFSAAARVGRCVETERLQLAFCLCLGFWGTLRTGEIFEVRYRHLLIRDQCMIVRLGDAKAGVIRLVDENVIIRHAPVYS